MSPDNISSVPHAPPASGPDATEKLIDAASRARSKATSPEHFAESNGGSADGSMSSTGTARSESHARAEPSVGAKRLTRAAHATANTLNHTAEYIRKSDAASMMSDAKRLAKDNPGLTLLGGAIIGFVLARLWARD
ncbi:MAG: hypothetical protein ACP5P4_06530 [Steroidobacteraceae bacterium]